jgi:DNA polymerase-3 subunit gamma/tau
MSNDPISSDAAHGDVAKSDSYVVVARRYRPRCFDDLVGQQQISQALINAIETNRVGHAYLFTGARGVGKTSTARIFAKALNAPGGPTANPDQESDISRAIDAGEDVDVLEIDGASNRGIDEIRQLRSNANVRPSRARYKIYIIDEVHMLTMAAFNALLKTLEEPPPHVKFILCTTDPQKIPITVLSRCQRYDFAPVDVPSIVERLEQIVTGEGREAEQEALMLLARRAEGSMRDSQSLLEQLLAYCNGPIRVDDVHQMLGTAGAGRLGTLMELLVARDAAGALRCVHEAAAAGVDSGQLAEQLLGHFRDMMAAHVGCGPELLRHSNTADHAQLLETGTQLGLHTSLAAFEILDQAVARMRYSTHPRSLLEIAIVRLCHLEDLDQLSDLIAQLRSGSVASKDTASSDTPSSASTRRTPPQGERASTPQKKNPKALGEAQNELSAPEGGQRLTPESAESIWKQVLEQLGDMTADFASHFDHLAIPAPDSLVVHFRERYTLHKKSCEQPERKAQLEDAMARIVGRKVRIDMVVIPEPESKQTEPPAPSLFQRMREKESHPFVRQAVELFEAEVVKVDVPRPTRRSGDRAAGSGQQK